MSRAAQISRGAGWRDIAARTLAAVPLNYAVTSALTVLIARLLPGGGAQASIGATMLSFAIFAVIASIASSPQASVQISDQRLTVSGPSRVCTIATAGCAALSW